MAARSVFSSNGSLSNNEETLQGASTTEATVGTKPEPPLLLRALLHHWDNKTETHSQTPGLAGKKSPEEAGIWPFPHFCYTWLVGQHLGGADLCPECRCKGVLEM